MNCFEILKALVDADGALPATQLAEARLHEQGKTWINLHLMLMDRLVAMAPIDFLTVSTRLWVVSITDRGRESFMRVI